MTIEQKSSSKMFSCKEIMELVEKDDRDGLKAAFETNGFDVNIKNRMGRTALHKAAMNDKVEILEILTSHPKIDINARDYFYKTPLLIAAEFGNVRSFELLFEKGADALCFSPGSNTVLWYAYMSETWPCVEMILRNERCIHDSNTVKWLNEEMRDEGISEIVKRLIIESSDPYYLNTFGHKILYYGCKKGSLDTVKLIVERDRSKANFIQPDCDRPLQIVLQGSFLDIADYLIEKGASMTFIDAYGRSVYDYAAEYDKSEAFLEKYEPEESFLQQMLVNLIIKRRQKTLRNYLEKCSAGKYPKGLDILKLVGENLTNISPYFHEMKESTKILLSQLHDKNFMYRGAKATIFSRKYELFNPFYERFVELEPDDAQIRLVRSDLFTTAMAKEETYICKYLLDQGLDPNEIVDGDPYFIRAIRHLDRYIVEHLLKNGADVHCKDKEGFTPLLLSAYVGRTRMKVDKDLSQRSDDVLTRGSRELEIVKVLIEAGACLTDVDIKNRNILHFAAENQSLCEFLFEKLDKEVFYTMVIALDTEGNRPLDSILKNKNMKMLSDIWLAIPNLIDLITSPIRIEIQKSDEEICPICRDELVKDDKAIVLPCKHMFHENCYKEWGKQNEKCPYCQRDTNKKIKFK